MDPADKFKSIWNMIIVILLFWVGIVTPYRLSFFSNEDYGNSNLYTFMEYIVDIVFGIDLIINFITGYENVNGQIEYRLRRIIKNYL